MYVLNLKSDDCWLEGRYPMDTFDQYHLVQRFRKDPSLGLPSGHEEFMSCPQMRLVESRHRDLGAIVSHIVYIPV